MGRDGCGSEEGLPGKGGGLGALGGMVEGLVLPHTVSRAADSPQSCSVMPSTCTSLNVSISGDSAAEWAGGEFQASEQSLSTDGCGL